MSETTESASTGSQTDIKNQTCFFFEYALCSSPLALVWSFGRPSLQRTDSTDFTGKTFQMWEIFTRVENPFSPHLFKLHNPVLCCAEQCAVCGACIVHFISLHIFFTYNNSSGTRCIMRFYYNVRLRTFQPNMLGWLLFILLVIASIICLTFLYFMFKQIINFALISIGFSSPVL